MSRLLRFRARLEPKHRDVLSIVGLVFISLLTIVALLRIYASNNNNNNGYLNSSQPTKPDRQPRILCWILTFNSTENNQKTRAVEQTWAKRCDKYLIVSNGSQLEREPGGQNVLRLPIEHESREQLWRKVVATNIYLYETYLQQFDWFMKADDDTYVLVESLRRFLLEETARRRPRPPPPPVPRAASPYEKEPLLVYYGHRFRPFVNQGYMSGGSGYVLSREALRRLVERGFEPNLPECRVFDTANEDVEIGKCLEAVGVEAGDTRDSQGRETFLPLSPSFLLSDNLNLVPWYSQYNFYKPTQGSDNHQQKSCCSPEPISFHYIDPHLMYLIDWLLYDVRHLEETKK